MDYNDFIESKKKMDVPTGLKEIPELNPILFDYQRDIVKWSLKRGRACIWADCGMGKSFMQLEWASKVADETNGSILILAPLAVSEQTIREGVKMGVKVEKLQSDPLGNKGIYITNYEQYHNVKDFKWSGIVLDESSILKSYTGKYRNEILENTQYIKYRLACTATPAPNDFVELGNHAEFVGAMGRTQMLSMFFINDAQNKNGEKWRLKGHAETEFWKWVSSWAVMITKPSDLGYEDNGFILPKLNVNSIIVENNDNPDDGCLFAMEARTLQERQRARKSSTDERCEKAVEIVKNNPDTQWLIWCNLNDESAKIKKLLGNAVEVKGSDKPDHKVNSMLGFAKGEVQILVSKPKICGLGMNFQSCSNMIFVGLSDSYEQYYQAVRRCWRFGQNKEVNCYIVTSSTEGAVVKNIERKEKQAEKMTKEMVKFMKEINTAEIKGIEQSKSEYREDLKEGDGWKFYLGDTVQIHKKYIADESIDYEVFSPPFASLYTYSNSDNDMGNCKNRSEFYQQYIYLIKEQFRTLKKGRLLSFHCMNLPTSKVNDGYMGLHDFRGEMIKLYQDAGFIYHSEVCIWKNPVTAMVRTKALGLLHKQICKDSCMSRQGVPDYLVTMRKPGKNENPVAGEFDHYAGIPDDKIGQGNFSIDVWQRYASPIWMDINQSDTLQYRSARSEKDEKHICPLQLEVIHRAVQMWSNPGDTVLTPFGGIGSEPYEALKMGRKAIAIELKESYWNQGWKNCKNAVEETKEGLLI